MDTETQEILVTLACPKCGTECRWDTEELDSETRRKTAHEVVVCEHLAVYVAFYDPDPDPESDQRTSPSWLGRRRSLAERSGNESGAVSVTAAARSLQVCTRTLKRWRQSGVLGPDEMWLGPTGRWYLSRGAVGRLGGKLS